MTDKSEAHLACRRTDVEIQRKIDRGLWRPSLDTGHIYSTGKHANLTEFTDKDGYLYIACNGSKTAYISRIIWIAAHGIPDFGLEVDHINGNRQDNRLQNLQLITVAENRMRANAVLTFADAEEIRAAYKQGTSSKTLAEKYNVSKNTIHCIIRGERYKSQPPHERAAARAHQQIAALDSETIAEICAEYKNGATYRQIAQRWHIAVTTVKAIIHTKVEVQP